VGGLKWDLTTLFQEKNLLPCFLSNGD